VIQVWEQRRKLRVAAVSFLNTAPLVWGLLHGRQRGLFDVRFCLPSECADLLERGEAEIGILPSAELRRQRVEILRGAGIASRGAVRSILLISKVPFEQIRVLAADTSSRTSVQLARVLLARNFGAEPRLVPCEPDWETMLRRAEAGVIIGDPALRVDVERIPYRVMDLGEQWTATTGLPMVFAVWAGRDGSATPENEEALRDSCRFGLEHLEEIVRSEAKPRGLSEELAREYLTERVRLELGPEEYQGLEHFLRLAGELKPSGATLEGTRC
jgi:predicted solute-binding protein